MKDMPKSKYDRTQGSFKGWLLRLTKWRIADQFEKRQRGIEHRSLDSAQSGDTSILDRLPDPNAAVSRFFAHSWQIHHGVSGVFSNVRLSGSWDASGNPSTAWSSTPRVTARTALPKGPLRNRRISILHPSCARLIHLHFQTGVFTAFSNRR